MPSTPTPPFVRAQLKVELTKHEMTRRELADRLPQSYDAVLNWIKGETPMTIENLHQISDAIGIRLRDWMSDAAELEEETHRRQSPEAS